MKPFCRALCDALVVRLIGDVTTETFTMATVSSGVLVPGQTGTRALRANMFNHLSPNTKNYFHLYYIITRGHQARGCTKIRYILSFESQKRRP